MGSNSPIVYYVCVQLFMQFSLFFVSFALASKWKEKKRGENHVFNNNMTTTIGQHIFTILKQGKNIMGKCVVLWRLSSDRKRCPLYVVMSQDTPPLFYYGKNCILWMLSCDRTCCPVDVVLLQNTPPLFYYGKNMLSYGCCHVTGHAVLWMLSCYRTPPPPPVLLWEKYVVM